MSVALHHLWQWVDKGTVPPRADRIDLLHALAPLADRGTTLATTAERAFSRALGGSCQTPIAAYAASIGSSETTRTVE